MIEAQHDQAVPENGVRFTILRPRVTSSVYSNSSPMDGIGPGDLQIESLVQRVAAGGINEVILALSTTMEGDTTNFYIYRKLEKLGVKLSVIARGISIGDELEYTDEVTLGRSIVNRTPFSGTA